MIVRQSKYMCVLVSGRFGEMKTVNLYAVDWVSHSDTCSLASNYIFSSEEHLCIGIEAVSNGRREDTHTHTSARVGKKRERLMHVIEMSWCSVKTSNELSRLQHVSLLLMIMKFCFIEPITMRGIKTNHKINRCCHQYLVINEEKSLSLSLSVYRSTSGNNLDSSVSPAHYQPHRCMHTQLNTSLSLFNCLQYMNEIACNSCSTRSTRFCFVQSTSVTIISNALRFDLEE